jgi:hypothetical protein
VLDDGMALLSECGLIERCRAKPLGGVRLFLVPEPAKKRFRIIRYTIDVNDAITDIEPVVFPTAKELDEHTLAGDFTVTLDATSFYDHFHLDPAVRAYFCFIWRNEVWQLTAMAAGQRQSVGIGERFLELLLSFPRRTAACDAMIDGARFVGTRQDCIDDARALSARGKTASTTRRCLSGAVEPSVWR